MGTLVDLDQRLLMRITVFITLKAHPGGLARDKTAGREGGNRTYKRRGKQGEAK